VVKTPPGTAVYGRFRRASISETPHPSLLLARRPASVNVVMTLPVPLPIVNGGAHLLEDAGKPNHIK